MDVVGLGSSISLQWSPGHSTKEVYHYWLHGEQNWESRKSAQRESCKAASIGGLLAKRLISVFELNKNACWPTVVPKIFN